MLYINPRSVKVIKAKNKFRTEMIKFVLKRKRDLKDATFDTSEIKDFLYGDIKDDIEDILMSEPGELFDISTIANLCINSSTTLKKGIKYIFDYDLFIKKSKRYDAYDLAESLDIRTCTYCNRNYTNTVITTNGRKLTRPQFDHYFDKATHPLLAISFYNLIPSCSICNSGIKGSNPFIIDNYLHPYLDDNINDIRFTYQYSDKTKSGLEINVITPNPSKVKNTVEAFAIEEIYNSHTGELIDLLKTKQYFSDRYLDILQTNLLKDVIVSKEDMYRIVFGTEYNPKDFVNRPFSKFKSDILKELGII
jgi:hypothetical protein